MKTVTKWFYECIILTVVLRKLSSELSPYLLLHSQEKNWTDSVHNHDNEHVGASGQYQCALCGANLRFPQSS